MTENKSNQQPFKLPSLDAIEKEGRQAADVIAKEILQDTLANGGKLDMKRIGKAGPTVQSAYLRLLSAASAMPEAEAQTKSPGTAKSPSTPKNLSSIGAKPSLPVQTSALPRTEVGWSHLQCPDFGFAAHAFRRGLFIAVFLGAAIIVAVRALNL